MRIQALPNKCDNFSADTCGKTIVRGVVHLFIINGKTKALDGSPSVVTDLFERSEEFSPRNAKKVC
jgi:hypothetical protein